MRSTLLGLLGPLLALALAALQSGCQAGNACGDPDVECRRQCKGGPENNMCWNNKVCTSGEWICYCRACTLDLGPKDLSIPHDLFSAPD